MGDAVRGVNLTRLNRGKRYLVGKQGRMCRVCRPVRTGDTPRSHVSVDYHIDLVPSVYVGLFFVFFSTTTEPSPL